MKKLLLSMATILLCTSISAYANIFPIRSDTVSCPTLTQFTVGWCDSTGASNNVRWCVPTGNVDGLVDDWSTYVLSPGDSLQYSSMEIYTYPNEAVANPTDALGEDLICKGKLITSKKTYDITIKAHDLQNCTMTSATSAKCEYRYAD